MNKEFKIGDLVKVADTGQVYTTYNAWLEHVGQLNNSAGTRTPKEGSEGYIVALNAHLSMTERIIAGVSIGGKTYMVGVGGLELVPEFDITAPVERQFLRSGLQVKAIYKNTAEGGEPALKVAFYNGSDKLYDYTLDGKNCKFLTDSRNDIVTRPELLPDVVTFVNIYSGNVGCSNETLEEAKNFANNGVKAIFKFTHNPNTDEITAEKVA